MPRWPTLEERLAAKLVRQASGCLLWTGGLSHDGYGRISVGRRGEKGREKYVHVLMYEREVGPVPDGLELDHRKTCSRACAEHAHLEPVTHRVNLLRGDTIAARAAAVTHCPAGHVYDEANTYVRPLDGSRKCRECHRERQRQYRAAHATRRP